MQNPLAQSHTLVIDDFQGMRTMLRDFIKSMGVTRIDVASSAKEAIEKLSANKFDIVICDYNLGPGQNGQQLLEEAKMRKYVCYSTIWIMVTAEKTMDMFMSAAETKPDDYLIKPINEAILEGRLQKLLSKKQSLGAIEKAVDAHDYTKAVALCDDQLKAQPANSQELLRIKSDLLMASGDMQAAKALFEKILGVRTLPWAQTGLGKVCYHNKDYLRAKEIFQEVLAENKMYLEAADWLAKTLNALGDPGEAQKVLMDAMALSPNSMLRQKSLGDTAYKNADLDVAHHAYEKAVKLSENSAHKTPTVFAGLAKVLNDKDLHQEALNVLDRTTHEFKDNTEAAAHSAVVKSMVYQKMGKTEEAQTALQEAEELSASLTGKANAEIAMDMAKSLFQMGDKEKACDMLQTVVKNNHENAELINRVEDIFRGEELTEEGENLIQQSKKEVIAINNEGVMLARDGKFEEGVALLRQAVHNLPNSEIFLTNLCGMLIGMMRKFGRDDSMIHEAHGLLERVFQINPTNQKYHEYLRLLAQIRAAE